MSHVDERDWDFADYFRSNEYVDDPFPYFDELRERSPIVREPYHNIVMVTGYDEAVQIFNDTENYSALCSAFGPFGGMPPLDEHADEDISELIEFHRDRTAMSDQLPTFDPPKHTAHRGLLMRLITPKRLSETEALLDARADQRIDTFIDRGRCEYLTEYGNPFALLVIADLLGVPEEDQNAVLDNLLNGPPRNRRGDGNGTENVQHAPLAFLYDQFSGYIEARRRDPRDDVLTGLALATFPDGSTPEVIDAARIAANLFAAGQETTVRLLGTALRLIADDPELQQRLRADRSLVPGFIEECLRTESPIKGDFRLAKRPTTVAGVDIPAGSWIFMTNSAGNRDPRKFGCPAEFRMERAGVRQHLAFGRGIHTCPGAPLARAEAKVSVNRILDRTSDIRLSDERHGPPGDRRFEYVPNFLLRGLTQLHLEFTPSADR